MLLLLSFASEASRDKFELLYGKYKRLCLKKAHDILRDYALAEDAVSEAYLRVYKNLDKIDDPLSGAAVAFVVTITRNVALTMLAKEKKHEADELEDTQSDSIDLEQLALSRETERDVYRVLESVSEELRSVFVLKFAYDLPHRRIGELLGITENNVTVRLHRAKKKLAELLVKEGYAGA